jgi:hypothetical protein
MFMVIPGVSDKHAMLRAHPVRINGCVRVDQFVSSLRARELHGGEGRRQRRGAQQEQQQQQQQGGDESDGGSSLARRRAAGAGTRPRMGVNPGYEATDDEEVGTEDSSEVLMPRGSRLNKRDIT